jgi:hypothetical protein
MCIFVPGGQLKAGTVAFTTSRPAMVSGIEGKKARGRAVFHSLEPWLEEEVLYVCELCLFS